MKTQVKAALRGAMFRRKRAYVATIQNLGRERRLDVLQSHYTNEYVRLSALELAVDEIITADIPGSVAELGVYKGDFAAILNKVLPDRTLYLFDTFEGFDKSQEDLDKTRYGLVYKRDFSDTSLDQVRAKLPNPGTCVFRKGLFPGTAAGLENERFCFVSIDPDLYQPIYDGLHFFYPRMSAGGFIFVHDYNNAKFPGARQAVRDFHGETGAQYVPIIDPYGTAIFRAP